MASITIEYMIMIPLLILQIFLFPYAASMIMDGWVDGRRTLVLQETASNLGSSISQLYSSLNHDTISTGTVTHLLELPMFIEGYSYTAEGTLKSALDSQSNSTQILEITLTLNGANIASTASITLGPNVAWVEESLLNSNSTSVGIIGEKLPDKTIQLSFL